MVDARPDQEERVGPRPPSCTSSRIHIVRLAVPSRSRAARVQRVPVVHVPSLACGEKHGAVVLGLDLEPSFREDGRAADVGRPTVMDQSRDPPTPRVGRPMTHAVAVRPVLAAVGILNKIQRLLERARRHVVRAQLLRQFERPFIRWFVIEVSLL